MPQLSPMMGFMVFALVLSSYLVFFCGVSKKPAKISDTKMKMSEKSSLSIFKLWNGSSNA
uniref:ATP synthase F0 subunit 8 n=1 Tax=Dermatobranchus otome TaxID=1504997 RepID=UPI001FF33833|nr:ATP synthase F0 subunit 8 [Dermatobranchus otome]UOD76588.1 ATP synthase F0 subunit 8 [Dermatobranchus otome]UOD76601.1 ATP synthase F0 subunit 8 [Dermatobranchus otome]